MQQKQINSQTTTKPMQSLYNKKIEILLIIIACILLFKCSNSEKEYFPNGQIKSEYETEDGKPNGSSILYYENGAVHMKCTFKNGKVDGLVTAFYLNGKRNMKDICLPVFMKEDLFFTMKAGQ